MAVNLNANTNSHFGKRGSDAFHGSVNGDQDASKQISHFDF